MVQLEFAGFRREPEEAVAAWSTGSSLVMSACISMILVRHGGYVFKWKYMLKKVDLQLHKCVHSPCGNYHNITIFSHIFLIFFIIL